ncbi:MAG: GDSL-type esterase/lipase family protein [Balneolales bacterium]|nr:GDSL-type esterase/lipase family protein [Balneolales bacterium]
MAKKTKKKSTPAKPLSARKKAVFYAITFSIPVLFFITLEVILRSVNYKGNNALFTDAGIPTQEYLIPNANFASRYFFYTNTVPNPSIDVFLKNKPEDGFRVFAMGGSTAAGYPYGFNGTFSRVVNDVLSDVMPDRTVEVINVGVSAINSYTLFDQVDEIIEQDPDMVMIYAGHNEFYGALGVGSNENLGGFPGFVRFYLKLQRLKTFLFIRSIIVDTGKWIGSTFSGEEVNENATLMERIVDSRSIELNSPKHELAMIQFESNMTAIIERFQSHSIPVLIGSVASNLKDHAPFVDIPDGNQPSALQTYNEAIEAYNDRNLELALEKFILAKDLDGLKFRAPSRINEIIRQLSEETQLVSYVPVEEELSNFSQDGIIGFDLMLEHLHPNQRGYFIIGRTFALSAMQELGISSQELPKPINSYFDEMFLSEFDTQVAFHRIETLKQGFPFIMGEKPEPYQFSYAPFNKADSLAFYTVHSDLGWDKAKVELAEYYRSIDLDEQAILEYMGLIRNQPWNDSPYIFAARIYLDNDQFDPAEPLLEKAFEINPNDAFITKMLGAIQVQKGNPVRGIELLEISRSINPNDPQMLYNRSGAYGTNQQFEEALKIAREVQQISPNFPGLGGWIQQLERITNR